MKLNRVWLWFVNILMINTMHSQVINQPDQLAQKIDTLVKQYQDLKTSRADQYDFQESELNTLGYQLLHSGRVTAAIAIFKLNIEMFPEAFNPYDSLGEAYMVAGDKELAIKNYAKSLELNPKNTNAIYMLQQINAASQ